MSLESSRTSVFTFQSSVHSSHVLRCLDEQRQKDLLCDVTVVVENQSFRAHRSVLASCSDYFCARMSSHTGQGLVINLPDEVTVEGFEPLLQFAYTSKLLFTKENVLEIRSSATILGFKNLDKACFDFLLPKFFDSSKSSSKGPRKCCKTSCWRAKAKFSFKGGSACDVEDVSPGPFRTKLEKKKQSSPSKPGDVPPCGTETSAEPETETEVESAPNYALLCPKYRKFQLACGKGLSYTDPSGSEAENTDNSCPLSNRPCSSSEDCEAMVTSKDTPEDNEEEDAVMPFYCPLNKQSPAEASLGFCPGQASMQICRAFEDICPVTALSMEETVESPAARPEATEAVMSDCCTETDCPCPSSVLDSDQRSSVEIEVANQLTSWPDMCASRASLSAPGTAKKTSELHWLRQLELGPRTGDCPFLRDMGAVDAQVRGSDQPSQSVESPYISSMHSGEDSDGFDTEGDSESYTNERASEMQLPFSVERIASLSRNDFQQMLKTHSLTREQLDFVHDVRRRSKNRIAARRCRKRKLDCIHNLECEIERLRSEKNKLSAEKRQLDQLKLKTWQSYSVLYERLCSEANLQPEQVQVFAKYTSIADCPFTAHLSNKACYYHCLEPELQPGLSTDTVTYKPGPSNSSALEPPAGGATANMKSLSAPGPMAALPNLHPGDCPHTEDNTVTSMMHVCPDQINKLETNK